MGGREVDTGALGPVTLGAQQVLDATKHVVRRVAAENADDLLELLHTLGLPTTPQQLRVLKAKAAIDQAAHAQRSKEQQ